MPHAHAVTVSLTVHVVTVSTSRGPGEDRSGPLLRTLAVIAVIVTGLLWFTGRASTQVLVTVIIGIAIVFSADAIVGAIAG